MEPKQIKRIKQAERVKQTKEITKKVLLALAGGAFLTLAMVAPGVLIAAKPLVEEWKKYDQRRLRAALKRMRKQRIIEFKETKNGETIIKITKKGEEKVLKYKFQDLVIPKPKKWDKIWRIVIFDIPNKKKLAREVLREKLKELGFYKIQKSVFVYPYECENEIEFIKAIFNIQPYILLIRAKEIDNEEFLRRYFNLD
ncbi:MAG: CRISPR-associated endonuclease Cas2 [Minisyncoccales bacterium]